MIALPGHSAIASKGWWAAHQWLVLRRSVQLAVLALYLAGPWLGIWWIKGTLASSIIFNTVPLTDPLVLLQSVLAQHPPQVQALIGAGIVFTFYLLVGGRVFCSWVCPINLITDFAAWLRLRLNMKVGRQPARATRYWLLGGILIASAITQSIAWEWINPVTGLQRGLVFGLGLAWTITLAIFIYDFALAQRGWCSHWCPVGAFYGLLGRVALIRVSTQKSSQCNDCMDCYRVCPEQHVIRPALKGEASPIILSGDCTNCGRCVDVCAQSVFTLTHRFNLRRE